MIRIKLPESCTDIQIHKIIVCKKYLFLQQTLHRSNDMPASISTT